MLSVECEGSEKNKGSEWEEDLKAMVGQCVEVRTRRGLKINARVR